MRYSFQFLCCFILFFNLNSRAQDDRKNWKNYFENGDFNYLEITLDSVIKSNSPDSQMAFKLLGEIYKVRGDIETANFFWEKSDSILMQSNSGWNSKAIQLAHQSNYFYEKFNHNKTQTYNDSLLFVLKKINEISISDCWIWNVVAQSNKLILSKTNKGIFLFNAYKKEVFPYYQKAIKQYSKSEEYQFDLARSYHLYANALVDVIHAINRDTLNIELKLKLERKANRLYDRAISIYKVNFDENHFEIARIRYVKALLYQYAHPEPTLDEREKAINLYEIALQSFNLEKPSIVVNITEALGAAKQYHRALFQSYRINPTNQLKLKQDSIFGLHNEFWKNRLNTFQTKNPNQLISLYGLSPFTERLYQIYFEYKHLALRDIDDVFTCMQKLKYQDKKHSNNTRKCSVKSIEDIKQLLKRRQCYLEFSIAPKPFVLIITKEQCELVEIKATNLDVIQFTESIINRDFSGFTESSIQLGEILLKSIELSNFDKLFITSSGWFSHIPFQSLLVSNKNIDKKDYRALDYLLKHVDIEYLFNASDINQTPSINQWSLDLFVPDYKEGLALPFAKRFSNSFKYKFRLFNDKKAISAAFNNSHSTIIHFSGHGNGSNSEREAAKIIFSDGSIGVEDIYTSEIQPHLVVLNSCSSGKGVYNAGDGIDGFPRAFYMNGVRQILSTFWNLDDRASHFIMEGFYKKLGQGVESNTALRESQINYISSAKNSDMAAPYYWAGHQFFGPSQSFEKQIIEKQSNWSVLWLTTPLIIGLLFYISLRIREARS